MARVYLMAGEVDLQQLIAGLHDDVGLRGVTVLRAVEGVGHGVVHTASLVDLGGDLPLIIEFFDVEEKVRAAVARIREQAPGAHIVCWDVDMEGED
jgi:PII-like signaling protein